VNSVAGRLLRLPLRLVPDMTPMRVLSGPLAGSRWLSTAGPHGCWIGIYERGLQETFVRTVRPGHVVYDVGANAGFFTLLASKLAGDTGKVVAVEPLARNLGLIREHMRLNGTRNVQVIEAALGDVTGEARFHTAWSPSMGSLDDEGDIAVKVTTLDALVAAGAPRPDVIKMDIEGAESRALLGARATLESCRPVVFLSTHGWKQHETCQALLRSLGFRLTLRRDGTADGQYELLAEPESATMA
jgi:FkbM family methyltransferase